MGLIIDSVKLLILFFVIYNSINKNIKYHKLNIIAEEIIGINNQNIIENH